eukprot:gene16340-22261_t
MFSSQYQLGDSGIEIFSPSGNDPFKIFKLNHAGTSNNNIQKVYDRNIKGYMLSIPKASALTNIQCPNSSRESLGIIQPFFVLQCQLLGQGFNLEIVVLDQQQSRKRLHFSTNFKEFDATALHTRIPWIDHNINGKWMNVLLDLSTLVPICFKGSQFSSVDSFTIRPVCNIRKIFTLPHNSIIITDTFVGNNNQLSRLISDVNIPNHYNFPIGVEYATVVLSRPMQSYIISNIDHNNANTVDITNIDNKMSNKLNMNKINDKSQHDTNKSRITNDNLSQDSFKRDESKRIPSSKLIESAAKSVLNYNNNSNNNNISHNNDNGLDLKKIKEQISKLKHKKSNSNNTFEDNRSDHNFMTVDDNCDLKNNDSSLLRIKKMLEYPIPLAPSTSASIKSNSPSLKLSYNYDDYADNKSVIPPTPPLLPSFFQSKSPNNMNALSNTNYDKNNYKNYEDDSKSASSYSPIKHDTALFTIRNSRSLIDENQNDQVIIMSNNRNKVTEDDFIFAEENLKQMISNSHHL